MKNCSEKPEIIQLSCKSTIEVDFLDDHNEEETTTFYSENVQNEETVKNQELCERVIVDIHCLQQLLDTSKIHSATCQDSQLIVTNGSWVNLEMNCKTCQSKFMIRKDHKKFHELQLNDALVLGAYNAGMGYNAIKHVFNSAEIAIIDKKTFQSTEEKVGLLLENISKQDLEKNILEEKRLAVEKGDVVEVDHDEIPFITVIVDAGWSKRSYGHSYNANAGCAVIIGARTNKILFVDHRIRSCAICDKKSNDQDIINTKKEHKCFKNW